MRGLRRGFAAWVRPAAGADPIPPYPLNGILRWLLAATFIVYWRAGQLRDVEPWDTVFVVAMLAVLAASDAAFLASRRQSGRLFAAWAFVLPLDIVVLLLAGALDTAELSPIPLLTVATFFTASAMFAARYTLSLSVVSGVGILATHLAFDLKGMEVAEVPAVIMAIAIWATGIFAATRGRDEARLRERLIRAQQNEAAHAAALRLALDAANVSEARFDALLEYAPALILVGNRKTNAVFSSRQVRDLFGDPGETFESVIEWSRTLLGEGHPLGTALAGAIAGHSTSMEFRATDIKGVRRDLSAVFFAMQDGIGLIARDVTEERALSAQITRAQQMETLGTLAGGVAHDFNNLLTAILGNLYLVRTEVDDNSPLVPMLDDAKRAGERGADLVRRLLAYGRPTVERTERVDLGRLLAETAALAERALTPRVRLKLDLPRAPAGVDGNFGALQQVLLNLLINARDAMPDGGVVTVSCPPARFLRRAGAPTGSAPAGDYQAIVVTDTGTGIPSALVDRIFDPFVTTKDVGKGTGLGLSTALGIVRAHGGWLEVETEEGMGSTFRVLLPAATDDAAAERASTFDARVASSRVR